MDIMQHACKTCSTFPEEYFVSMPVKLNMHIITVDNNSVSPKDLRGFALHYNIYLPGRCPYLWQYAVIILWQLIAAVKAILFLY